MKKTCGQCGKMKDPEDFYAQRRVCKFCIKERSTDWTASNPAKRAAIVKKSRNASSVWREYANKWKKLSGDTQKRRSAKANRTPGWLSVDDFWMMREAYSLCYLRSKITGVKHHVDHIYPLRGKSVCGLHVPCNLQVIPAFENLIKSNKMEFSA
jgi:hypothetical protein